MAIRIEPAEFPRDAETIHTLFSEYASSTGLDLTFQHFQDELATLPGKYTEAENGALFIAWMDEPDDSISQTSPNNPPPSAAAKAVGCVALRHNTTLWSEMKRLYVCPEARGLRLGEQLVQAIIARAKVLGYRGIRLDTLANMTAAQGLYRKCGFREIEPYYETPVEATVFMGCYITI